MLCVEITSVYCENRKTHTFTLKKHEKSPNVTASRAYRLN
jgi:hypothetical protein